MMPLASLTRLIALGAIWGSSFAFMRLAVPEFGPLRLIALRLMLAALLLAAVALATGRSLKLKGNGGHFVFIGVVNSALPFFLFAFAAKSLPAALLAVFNSLAPAFGAVVARAWLKTPVTLPSAAGLCLGVAGVGVIASDSLTATHIAGATGTIALALLAGVMAPICYAIASVYIKQSTAKVSPFDNALGSMCSAALACAPVALFVPNPGAPQITHWGAVAALGLLCTGAAYLLSFRLIADLGPTRALTVTFLVPLFGVIWGVLFLHETLTPLFLCGGLMVVLGTALANGSLTGRKPP